MSKQGAPSFSLHVQYFHPSFIFPATVKHIYFLIEENSIGTPSSHQHARAITPHVTPTIKNTNR
ncbi:hypothetical protein YC2023_007837 [Brassica napus]